MNMPKPKTKVVCKSLWRGKNCKRTARFARMRAAKERLRIERLTDDVSMPDVSHCPIPKSRPSGFLITIKCLDDGERVKIRTHRDPWGRLLISPTTAGRQVAALLANYLPA